MFEKAGSNEWFDVKERHDLESVMVVLNSGRRLLESDEVVI